MTTITTRTRSAVLKQHEILTAAKLIEGCRKNVKVTWAVNGDVGTLLTGQLRYIERTNQATGEVAVSDDIRDQWVRITTTFEHWILVGDVMQAISDGLFIFERP